MQITVRDSIVDNQESILVNYSWSKEIKMY